MAQAADQKQVAKVITRHLKDIQSDFCKLFEFGKPIKKKLPVDMEVNEDSIVFFLDIGNTGYTIALDAEFDGNEVIELSINEIEASSFDGEYMVQGDDDLLLECKRILHDAAFYNLDEDLTTDFYSEVYA